jgi:hypothetical protein
VVDNSNGVEALHCLGDLQGPFLPSVDININATFVILKRLACTIPGPHEWKIPNRKGNKRCIQ